MTTIEQRLQIRLAELELVIQRGLATFVEVGTALAEIRERRLYPHRDFESYCRERWGWSMRHAERHMEAARVIADLQATNWSGPLPANEAQVRALAGEPDPEVRAQVWETISARPEPPTARAIQEELQIRRNGDHAAGGEENGHPVLEQDEEMAARPKFNRVNENIDWAWWSWNPVTGCLHNCPYCYARDIANRFYPQKFEPYFHDGRDGKPNRLLAPQNTKLPDAATIAADPRARNVFVCSMADLFGKWVEQEWIDAVFEQVKAAPDWRFLCLTKFPQRLAELDWPENAWVGTSVDRQHRVRVAEKAFAGVKAGLRWLSCEPLLEPLQFESLEMFDWVVIGAQSRSTGAPEFQPPVEWILDLIAQARAVGACVYVKPNVAAAPPPCPTCGTAAWPKEVPWS